MTTTQHLLHSMTNYKARKQPLDRNLNNPAAVNCTYPRGLMPLPTQIAGHGSEGDGHRAILKRDDGKILKPVQPPPKGPREAKFYVDINRSLHPADQAIKQHIPKFFGIEQVGFVNGVTVTEEFLVLEDLTEGFELPSVMDVKIGKKTWGPDASQAKILQESAKYVGTKGPFGYSVLGMIVHAFDIAKVEQVTQFDKSFGKTLKSEDIGQVPEIFFNDTPKVLARIVVAKMKAIRDVFENQRRYKLFASSLLLAYDTQAVRRYASGVLALKDLELSVNVKLIDFAHVFDANEERDGNFLDGLNNLIKLFESFSDKA